MHFTPREIDKLMIYMLAQIAQKRKDQGLKLNHPETVSLITAAALDVGYNSPSAFAAMFRRTFGVSPTHYVISEPTSAIPPD